eukprot:1159779-Pelagomonas_calceolata.AAC.2
MSMSFPVCLAQAFAGTLSGLCQGFVRTLSGLCRDFSRTLRRTVQSALSGIHPPAPCVAYSLLLSPVFCGGACLRFLAPLTLLPEYCNATLSEALDSDLFHRWACDPRKLELYGGRGLTINAEHDAFGWHNDPPGKGNFCGELTQVCPEHFLIPLEKVMLLQQQDQGHGAHLEQGPADPLGRGTRRPVLAQHPDHPWGPQGGRDCGMLQISGCKLPSYVAEHLVAPVIERGSSSS